MITEWTNKTIGEKYNTFVMVQVVEDNLKDLQLRRLGMQHHFRGYITSLVEHCIWYLYYRK